MEDGFKQAAAFGLGGRELLFQPFAEGHQFVHSGGDAVLFGQRWNRDLKPLNLRQPQVWNTDTLRSGVGLP